MMHGLFRLDLKSITGTTLKNTFCLITLPFLLFFLLTCVQSMAHSELRRLIKERGIGNETRIEEALADCWAKEHRRKEGEHEEGELDDDEDAANLSYVNEMSDEDENATQGAKAHAVARRARATCDDVVQGSHPDSDHHHQQEDIGGDDDDDESASVFAAYMAAASPPSPATRSSSSRHSQRHHKSGASPTTSEQPRVPVDSKSSSSVANRSPSKARKGSAASTSSRLEGVESRGNESGVASDSIGPSVRFSSDAS